MGLKSLKYSSRYPRGLFFLVFTEFWERFGYYLMVGIFFLYMTASIKDGGMGWQNADASDIFGTFVAIAYLTPFVGGLLADLKLGYRLSISLGGILMGVGYCVLAIHETWAFYTALVLMLIGNGFFKPNISTILGNLFNDPRYQDQKDAGYNIFYMGINLGAFICNFIAAIIHNKIGWSGAFIAAGIGMFIGVITFWMGMKHYRHVDIQKEPHAEDKPMIIKFCKVLFVSFIFAAIGWLVPTLLWGDGAIYTISGSRSNDAFFMFCFPVIYFYASVYKNTEIEEREPLRAMFTIFMVVILFWAIFQQNATALTIYAQKYTDRESPAAISKIVEKLGFAEKVVAKQEEVPYLLDSQFRPIKETTDQPIKYLIYPQYFQNIDPAKMPAQGQSVNLINTEVFQSINPFFVIILTPLIVSIFALMRRKSKEPTTASKITLGLLIGAFSTLIMVAAVYSTGNGAIKASSWWLISAYGMITVGELLLSPMGLSMVSKLSPTRLTSLMMGGWLLATAIGNKLSGILAKNWDKFDNKANYFLLNFALLLLAFLIIMLFLKSLNKVFNAKIYS